MCTCICYTLSTYRLFTSGMNKINGANKAQLDTCVYYCVEDVYSCLQVKMLVVDVVWW